MNEILFSGDILEVKNARVTYIIDIEDQRQHLLRTFLEISEYLFRWEVVTIDATIITQQKMPPIMINLITKLFCYTGTAIVIFYAINTT